MFTLLTGISRRTWITAAAASVLCFLPGLSSFTQQQVRAQAQQQRQPADLSGGVAWLNTDKAMKLEDLRGRIVLLDFWTLC